MVNTFLLCGDYKASAEAIDPKRLVKQAVEAKQLIVALECWTKGEKRGFQNHPAAKQWRGHIDSLKMYYNAHVAEAVRRGILKLKADSKLQAYDNISAEPTMPEWTQCPHVWYSHRASLWRKMPWYYDSTGKTHPLHAFPVDYATRGYFWPTRIASLSLLPHCMEDAVSVARATDKAPVWLASFLDTHCDPPQPRRRQCAGILASGKNRGTQCQQAVALGADEAIVHCGTHLTRKKRKPAAAAAVASQSVKRPRV